MGILHQRNWNLMPEKGTGSRSITISSGQVAVLTEPARGIALPRPRHLSDSCAWAAGHGYRGRTATVMTARSDTDALMQDLSTRLIAGATATETLLAWCDEHGLSQGPITVECRQQHVLSTVPDDVRAALALTAGETVHFRQVRIMRGTLPLAMAENWFVPQRLAASMNAVLQTTDVPFGTIIAPLRPSRRTLVARVRSLTADPSEDPSRPSASAHHSQPDVILEHTAVICSGTGTVLALVTERFFSELVSLAAKPSLSRGLGRRSRAGSVPQPVRLER